MKTEPDRGGATSLMHMTLDRELLRRLRDEHGYSISDMSALLGYKTPTGYWLIEHGQRRLTIESLYELSKLYEMPMEDFLKEASAGDEE